MENNVSNYPKDKKYSEYLKFQKENIICEDGFCSMPNLKEKPDINENDTNIFEPTQIKKLNWKF